MLQSRPLCPEDLVGQLQAVTGLWAEVLQLWGWPRCAARRLSLCPESEDELRLLDTTTHLVQVQLLRTSPLHTLVKSQQQGGAFTVTG